VGHPARSTLGSVAHEPASSTIHDQRASIPGHVCSCRSSEASPGALQSFRDGNDPQGRGREPEPSIRRHAERVRMGRAPQDVVAALRRARLADQELPQERGLSSEFPYPGPSIPEVMVNGPDDVYVERKGRIKRGGWRRHGNRRWARRSRLLDPFLTPSPL
jgi:hypothetical protein